MNATLYTHINKRECRLQKAFSHHPFRKPRALVITKLHLDTVRCIGISCQRPLSERSEWRHRGRSVKAQATHWLEQRRLRLPQLPPVCWRPRDAHERKWRPSARQHQQERARYCESSSVLTNQLSPRTVISDKTARLRAAGDRRVRRRFRPRGHHSANCPDCT